MRNTTFYLKKEHLGAALERVGHAKREGVTHPAKFGNFQIKGGSLK